MKKKRFQLEINFEWGNGESKWISPNQAEHSPFSHHDRCLRRKKLRKISNDEYPK